MHQQRFASVLASKGRSLLLWTTPLALTAAVGMAVGGCPGPDPQTMGSGGNGGGRGASSVEASSTSSQGGSSNNSASVSTGTGKADGGCGPDRQVCDGMCADTTNGDILNCGKCGNACATNNVDQADCVNSACVLQCADGFASVDPMNPKCDTPARRVFVSSMAVNSKFGSSAGGIHAANQFCNQMAPAGGATFAAWVSVSDQTAATTIIGSFMGAYVLMDMRHTVVATSMELLAGSMLRHAIDTTESGNPLSPNTPTPVWTGTNGNGVPTGFDCGGWLTSSTTATATIGSWSAVDASWSNVGQPTGCGADNYVYCFEL